MANESWLSQWEPSHARAVARPAHPAGVPGDAPGGAAPRAAGHLAAVRRPRRGAPGRSGDDRQHRPGGAAVGLPRLLDRPGGGRPGHGVARRGPRLRPRLRRGGAAPAAGRHPAGERAEPAAGGAARASSGRGCCGATSTSTATGATTSPTRCSPRTCPASVLARWRAARYHADPPAGRCTRAGDTPPSSHRPQNTSATHRAPPWFAPPTCITSPLRVTHVTGGVRMGSGVLLAALVVLWFVVLVPMVVTRGDAQGGRAELADSGRTLQRRRTVDPVVHAETERVSSTATCCAPAVSCRWTCTPSGGAPWAAWSPSPRCRLVGALVYSPWLWIAQVLFDVAVVGYVLVLRKVARRERLAARRAARAAAREALRAAPPAAVAPVRRRRCTRPSPRPDLPHPSVPLAPVAQFRARRRHGPHAGPGRLAAERRRRSGRRRHRVRRHRRVPAAPGRQPLGRPAPALRAAPVLASGSRDGKSVRLKGLWRSPVAHLVRIEGVRGSTPLSSTPSPHDQQTPSGPRPGGVRRSRRST